MFYILTRFFIALILFLIAMFFIKKSKKGIKIKSVIVFIISIILFSTSYLFPVENFIISFNNPSEAFNYYRIGSINKIIEGEKSCLINYSNNNDDDIYEFILKDKTGYKIGSFFNQEKISRNFKNGIHYTIYNIKNTNDYYICGTISNVSEGYNLHHNIETEIIINPEKDDNLNTYILSFYTYLKKEDVENYKLFINDILIISDINI